jgi:hypothetical protein
MRPATGKDSIEGHGGSVLANISLLPLPTHHQALLRQNAAREQRIEVFHFTSK